MDENPSHLTPVGFFSLSSPLFYFYILSYKLHTVKFTSKCILSVGGTPSVTSLTRQNTSIIPSSPLMSLPLQPQAIIHLFSVTSSVRMSHKWNDTGGGSLSAFGFFFSHSIMHLRSIHALVCTHSPSL